MKDVSKDGSPNEITEPSPWKPIETTRGRLERDENGRARYLGTMLPSGPWHDEPDEERFEAHGHPCLLLRNPLGAWCGYVAIAPGHPWHGIDYGQIDAEVHGGLTYANACAGHICHVPKPGEPDDVWWLGFDCIHAGDLSLSDIVDVSGIRARMRVELPSYDRSHESYKTIGFARNETIKLAQQAAEATRSAR